MTERVFTDENLQCLKDGMILKPEGLKALIRRLECAENVCDWADNFSWMMESKRVDKAISVWKKSAGRE